MARDDLLYLADTPADFDPPDDLDPSDPVLVNDDYEPVESLCVPYIDVLKKAWQAYRVPEPLNFPRWADKHFFLAPESSGLPGAWQTFPYQNGIMLMMGSDAVRAVIIQKPARVGYTKMIAALVCYHIVHKLRNVAFWQPTETDADEFVADEINPLFEYVPSFADALLSDHTKAKDPRNTNSRKVFRGAVLHVKGAKSAANFRRITVDTAILDEHDGMDAVIKGTQGKEEGSASYLASIRTTDSAYAKFIDGSTPTVKGASLIEGELLTCDVVLERYIPCVHCDHPQVLRWGDAESRYGVKWDKEQPKTARYECEHCHRTFVWTDMLRADAAGFWASPQLRLVEDDDNPHFVDRRSGEAVTMPERVGFTFSTLISHLYSWSPMVAEFLTAQARHEMGDSSFMRVFHNTRLGLTFEEGGVEALDAGQFLARREPYGADVPLQVVSLTAGIDVQGDRIEVEIQGWGRGEECWAIAYHVFIGDTSLESAFDENGEPIIMPDGTLAHDTVWDKLDNYLNTPLQHEAGHRVTPSHVCIDSGYMTSQVYEFCRRNPLRYIPVKGQGGPGRQLVQFSGQRTTRGVFLAHLSADNLQDTLHARYVIEEDGPGRMHWPLRFGGPDADPRAEEREPFGLEYFSQKFAETKVLRVRGGQPVTSWVCEPGRRNEATDTGKYNLAAITIAQQYFGLNLNLILPREAARGGEDTVPSVGAIAARLNKRRGQR